MQGWLWGWGDGLILSHLWLRVDGLILLSVAVGSWNPGQAQDSNPDQGRGWAPSVKLSKWDFLKKTRLVYSKVTACLTSWVSPLFQTAYPKSSSVFWMWFYSSCFCEGFAPSCNRAAQNLLDFLLNSQGDSAFLPFSCSMVLDTSDETATNPTLASDTCGLCGCPRAAAPHEGSEPITQHRGQKKRAQ